MPVLSKFAPKEAGYCLSEPEDAFVEEEIIEAQGFDGDEIPQDTEFMDSRDAMAPTRKSSVADLNADENAVSYGEVDEGF